MAGEVSAAHPLHASLGVPWHLPWDTQTTRTGAREEVSIAKKKKKNRRQTSRVLLRMRSAVIIPEPFYFISTLTLLQLIGSRGNDLVLQELCKCKVSLLN